MVQLEKCRISIANPSGYVVNYKKHELAEEIVKKLNECLEKDYDAINHLFWNLTAKVNDKLANDPHVQVRQPVAKRGYYLGFLGLLNGLLLYLGSGVSIVVNVDEKHEIENFSLVDNKNMGINSLL